jgi:hypothetical protein
VVGAEDPGETSQIRRSKNTEINLPKPQAIIRSRKNFDPKNIFDPKIDYSIILKSAFDARGGYGSHDVLQALHRGKPDQTGEDSRR